MDFHGIDLNLLAAFDALMIERNVTRAAARVGVSQPAMSAALSRLRQLFDDRLFLRSADGLLPTPLARDIANPISQALRQIEAALVEKPEFVPERMSLTFTLGMSEYAAIVLLPALARALEKRAPGVTLNVHAFNGRDSAVDLLDAGTIDLAVGVPPRRPESRILTKSIFRDEFVTIVRRDSAAAKRGMSMDAFLALSHVLVSPEGDRYGLVDQALAQMGKHRTLALTLPQMLAVPAVIAQTDMTATVMKRVVLHSSVQRDLVLFPPPIVLPSIDFHLIWHRRSDPHPAQQWFRELIATLGASLD
ncbi:LysR family transcriptional regulator [Sodalis ligni]|uniref:DNA-binding transcriptional LysR family regulator n=1 Tax=Sodalis ligni TaxID=2697027 RepID=A0A4R1NES3_9GAMM|nr:LysR family transcriptional regulator [Sodalis ligni]TCL05379.1 DNA-binding transcriptional LysR family regulator [Sodalis ligni]